MKNSLIISLLILLISSCGRNSVEFNVQNKTNTKIDSIAIYVRGSQNNHAYFSLIPNESKTYILDMRNIGMGDGSYRIDYQLTAPQINKIMHFGYFTSGSSQNELINIELERDTILFEYE